MNARPSRNLLVGIAFNAYDPRTSDPATRASEESVEQAARDVLAAVTEIGFAAFVLPLEKSLPDFLRRAQALRADVLVNLCEAFAGRSRLEANVAAALELTGIPFTGNNSRAMVLCLDKFKAKEALIADGLPTPPAVLIDSPDGNLGLPFPVIVKPNAEDASLGIHPDSVVRDEDGLRRRLARLRTEFPGPALVESFIDGREFNIAVLDVDKPEALPVSEIRFDDLPEGQPAICGYEAKWLTEDILCKATPPVCPAPIEDGLRIKLQEIAVRAFQAAGCRDYARVDFRVDREGRPFILEVNPNPDINRDAGYARALAAAGIEYPAFWKAMIEKAGQRRKPS